MLCTYRLCRYTHRHPRNSGDALGGFAGALSAAGPSGHNFRRRQLAATTATGLSGSLVFTKVWGGDENCSGSQSVTILTTCGSNCHPLQGSLGTVERRPGSSRCVPGRTWSAPGPGSTGGEPDIWYTCERRTLPLWSRWINTLPLSPGWTGAGRRFFKICIVFLFCWSGGTPGAAFSRRTFRAEFIWQLYCPGSGTLLCYQST